MKKICTIIGARPQFIKAAPFHNEIRKHFTEVIIHTGQHFDYEMSEIFFDQMNIAKPDYNLGINGGSHGYSTGKMLIEIEQVVMKEKPIAVVVFGDTNSTLAGALAASKLDIPIAHIESGLRSFNRKMPEEINRIVTDQLSSFLFVPSDIAIQNLFNEGITHNVFNVGDIMLDALLMFKDKANLQSHDLKLLNLPDEKYTVATIHRAENTDNETNLINIIDALGTVDSKVILPIHPRTKKYISNFNIAIPKNIIQIEPLGYLDMLRLMQNAYCIFTDSGGIQKEAYYLEIPCITFRNETEWVETIDAGWNVLTGANQKNILNAYKKVNSMDRKKHPNLYGEGDTAVKISKILFNFID